MKKILALLGLTLLPCAVAAAEPPAIRPNWSLEVKGGALVPEMQMAEDETWSDYYGRRDVRAFGGSLSYKPLRQVEVGIEVLHLRADGMGKAPVHGTITGEVRYELAPLNVFVLARGAFSANQWLIPYAGGGWTRMFYREEVLDQGVTRGFANGYHARAGLQLVLDGLDPHAAHSMRSDYGIEQTSLFFEAEYIRAMADTVSSGAVDLGGKSLLAGLLFEF